MQVIDCRGDIQYQIIQEGVDAAELPYLSQKKLGGLGRKVQWTRWVLSLAAIVVLSIFLQDMIVAQAAAKGLNPTDNRTSVPDSGYNAKHGAVKTVDLGGGVKLEMVYLEQGQFQMGSKTGHTVTLSQGFWIGKYEVTQSQYEQITGSNPSFFKGSNRPVESVSWKDAMAFCRKLSSRTGQTFTLPTEAQWEYACRAGTSTAFSFGNCLNTSDANYNGNYPMKGCSKGQNRKTTWDVGNGRTNGWGLVDMHGNVYEWCLDWHGGYPSGNVTEPAGPASGFLHIFRGGSWDSYAGSCRSGLRDWNTPTLTENYLGFRVVMVGF